MVTIWLYKHIDDTFAMQTSNKMVKLLAVFSWLLFSFCLLPLFNFSEGNQADSLRKLLNSRRSQKPPLENSWIAELETAQEFSPVYIAPQDGLEEADRLKALPGQPHDLDFKQYSGYVQVDPKGRRALFYYFVESPENSSKKPLVLWLNGGPGCSSLGFGALTELGPFRVNIDGRTLFRNDYAWNKVANVLFLESPAGVGFSYTDLDETGDKQTAADAYTFLVNWLERFPKYKTRDFYITGESYAGHYVPQLAYTILLNNKNTNQIDINLKGIAIGNALIDDGATTTWGVVDYIWSHALISDESFRGIHKYCNFSTDILSEQCKDFLQQMSGEAGDIDPYDIYTPICHKKPALENGSWGSIHEFDPCSGDYVNAYLNVPDVQTALHAHPTNWKACSDVNFNSGAITILPIIKKLMEKGIRIWIYSGDFDSIIPVTSTRYSINKLKLPITHAWRAWYTNNEVGGYVEAYKGLTFVTVRGSGHMVPSYQPERALTMISSFLQGTLPPSS